MQIKFSSVYWNGAMVYVLQMPKDATVIDCFCVNSDLRIAYLSDHPTLDVVDRKFKVVGDWEDGIDLGKELAYVGMVHYSVVPLISKMQLHLPGGAISEVPLVAPGEKFFPEIETYIMFEVLNGKETG